MSRFSDLDEEFYVSKRKRAYRPFLEASFNRWEIPALAKKRKKMAKYKKHSRGQENERSGLVLVNQKSVNFKLQLSLNKDYAT